MLEQGLGVAPRGAEQVAGFGEGHLPRRFHGAGQLVEQGLQPVRAGSRGPRPTLTSFPSSHESVDDLLGVPGWKAGGLPPTTATLGASAGTGAASNCASSRSDRLVLRARPARRPPPPTRNRAPSAHLTGGHKAGERFVESRPFLAAGQIAPKIAQGQVGIQSVALASARRLRASRVTSTSDSSDGPWKRRGPWPPGALVGAAVAAPVPVPGTVAAPPVGRARPSASRPATAAAFFPGGNRHR